MSHTPTTTDGKDDGKQDDQTVPELDDYSEDELDDLFDRLEGDE